MPALRHVDEELRQARRAGIELDEDGVVVLAAEYGIRTVGPPTGARGHDGSGTSATCGTC